MHAMEATTAAPRTPAAAAATLAALLLLLLPAAQPASQPDAVPVPVAVAVVGEEVPPGSSAGCKRQDRFYAPGVTWQEDEGCMSCTCERGVTRCQAFMCQVTCDNPRRVHGECCPICDGQSVVTQALSCPSLGNCTLKCTHGFVMDDETGCYTCQCQQGAACMLECPAGYARDAAGNPLCECACPAMSTCTKRCTHGYLKDPAGCSRCACKPAAEAMIESSRNDSTARTCSEPGRDRDDGEYWSDGCRGCYCSAGRTLCELASCRDHTSDLRRMAELALCSDGDGAALQSGCVSCRCLMGRVLCEAAACPPAACADPLPPDAMGCCPTCPAERPPPGPPDAAPAAGCGGGHGHGTSWRLSDCTSCRCRHGLTECFEQRCPPPQCGLHFTPRGMCCPLCLGDRGLGSKPPALVATALPAPPAEPRPPDAARPQGGPPAPAPHGAPQGGTCRWRGQAHAAGAEWFPDECTRCRCDPAGSGSSTCTQLVCAGCAGAAPGATPGAAPGAAPADHPAPAYCCPQCAVVADGGATLLVVLLVVTALLVLAVLGLGYFMWHRSRRQTLDIARADVRAPAAAYTYNVIPTEKPLAR